MDIKIGDTVRLKKKHPCGSYELQVVRLGADIGIKCLQCQHRILLPRSVLERRIKAIISREEPAPGKTAIDRMRELEEKLADLLARWPAHSVPLHMWQQREDLEEELERLKKETEIAEDAE
ncbi:MAG TPA: DUF951 domain-containing protein [Dehalococcoidales bacterium]|nr:DUF951 domain-containing protein [Dehalococcoidales bacterium]